MAILVRYRALLKPVCNFLIDMVGIKLLIFLSDSCTV